MDFHLWLIVRLLFLLALANTTPVLVHRVLGRYFSSPIDGGLALPDGQPLFGSSKTIRGVLFSILITTTAATLFGLKWRVGIAIGSSAMAGDLFSSFLKRRMGLAPGGKATGLDQIPESLFPVLACHQMLSLTMLDIAVTVAVFFLGEVFLARLFYKFHLRERPY